MHDEELRSLPRRSVHGGMEHDLTKIIVTVLTFAKKYDSTPLTAFTAVHAVKSMSDTRKIEFDVEAILLVAICAFMWISLLTYDPADAVGPLPAALREFVPIDTAVYPANEQPQNACGWFGALFAQLMIQSLGIGSILVTTGLTVLAVWMFRVQSNY
ncbi:MAG: DNA translocase FtsK 4TM domain-containing protein, partial [bacterium]|nr:DNA translocase FtsK 4TM domain-containing protein [bacterium]